MTRPGTGKDLSRSSMSELPRGMRHLTLQEMLALESKDTSSYQGSEQQVPKAVALMTQMKQGLLGGLTAGL